MMNLRKIKETGDRDMKHGKAICSFIAGLCMIAGLSLQSHAQNFEGVIHYEFEGASQNGMGDIPYMIKGDKVRMQFGDGQSKGAMIFLPADSKMLFVLDNMKSYMNVDTEKWMDNDAYDSKWDDSEMTRTGQSKTVAGYSCEVWQVTNGSDQLNMCMAEGLGTFMSPGNPMARQNAPAWAKKIIADGYMPLEVVEESADGSTTVQMKATKIEETSLSDSLFEVPDGYKNMSSMMQQMMKQRNN